jgi:hypothetical protein
MGARYLASFISPLADAPGASAMHAVRNAIAATSSLARRKATDCVYDRLAAPASLSQMTTARSFTGPVGMTMCRCSPPLFAWVLSDGSLSSVNRGKCAAI